MSSSASSSPGNARASAPAGAGADARARRVGALLAAAVLAAWAGAILLALRPPYAGIDDMAQHVVWFRRYLPHPALAGSPIGDFFIGSNGPLYRALYAGVAALGVDPVAFAFAVALASAVAVAWAAARLVAAVGGGRWAVALAPATMLLFLSFRDDVGTGTARGIAWPLLVAALWLLRADRPLAFAGLLGAGALVYPPVVALLLPVAGLDRALEQWRARRWWPEPRWVAALAIPALVLIAATALLPDAGGPSVTAAQARLWPEFQAGGRANFFGQNAWDYWLFGRRSGLLPMAVTGAWPVVAGALVALAAGLAPPPARRLAVVLALVSLLLWAAAHVTLFALYLPSRFPSYGLGAAVALLCACALGRAAEAGRGRAAALAMAALPLLLWPLGRWPVASVAVPESPSLLAAMAGGAPGRVAGWSRDLDRVPVAIARDVLWSRETALPYKQGHRNRMRDVLADTIVALAAPNRAPLLAWARANQVAWILLPADALAPRRDLPPALATLRERPDALRAWHALPAGWLARQHRCRLTDGRNIAWGTACLARQR